MPNQHRSEPFSFDAFRDVLADLLDLDADLLRPEAFFISDLGVDSLRLFELWLRLEARGIVLPIAQAWQVRTVEDAYRLYRGALAS